MKLSQQFRTITIFLLWSNEWVYEWSNG